MMTKHPFMILGKFPTDRNYILNHVLHFQIFVQGAALPCVGIYKDEDNLDLGIIEHLINKHIVYG